MICIHFTILYLISKYIQTEYTLFLNVDDGGAA